MARVYQALRIEVNDEMSALREFLEKSTDVIFVKLVPIPLNICIVPSVNVEKVAVPVPCMFKKLIAD